MKILFAALISLIVFIFPTNALARSGCCSWHGGVCGCGCCDGTPLSSTCAPYYPSCGYSRTTYTSSYLYLPSNPNSGSQTYTLSGDNWCNYDVHAKWDASNMATGYSVAISKTAGGNPGPLVDTSGTSFTFKNIPYGRWYINIRAHNSYGWATNIVYWTLDIPKASPTFDVNLRGEQIDYDFSCMKQINAPSFFIDSMKSLGNIPRGSIKVADTSRIQNMLFQGTDNNGKKYEKNITYTPPTPTPSTPTTTSNPTSILGWLALGGIGFGVYKIFRKS